MSSAPPMSGKTRHGFILAIMDHDSMNCMDDNLLQTDPPAFSVFLETPLAIGASWKQ
jgi:hypothetical protein